MNNFSKISVVILAKNAQVHLRECLEALCDFDEIILLDNESTDDTQIIAGNFKNVKIYESEFIGFGPLKNLAISYAKHDWILSIDSDEVLEKDALEMIKHLSLDSKIVYSLSRKNLYKGEWIQACGWSPDYVRRLFCKDKTCFNQNQVHESVIIPDGCREIKLNGYLRHYAFESVDMLLGKLNRYSTIWADEKKSGKKKASVFGAIGRFVLVFLKDYFFRKGFLYGYKGFIVAYCNADGAFFKYMKLYERRQESQEK
ncbi:glycosyltransferase family 2 protein [Helicobacter sp. 11S03491-1]|uniref:glycosyltransferase family 2 protein n=1 Tax=Helicobacter sp. 11S03491-1 TaxID=1476196 RepID=UPI000BA7B4FA|nr:glycosyltransferase family 2 protein [Helicobacter sp. 11S03491-1]PAF42302.1 glycosyltransferase [Helicobacter sp. 11S03491-1]